MRPLTPKIWTLLLLSGCAGCAGAPSAGAGVRSNPRSDLDSLREEVRTLRRENDALSVKVQSLAAQVDLLTYRASRDAGKAGAADPDGARGLAEGGAAVPADLTVVRMSPPASGHAPARAPARLPRAAPVVPTAVPIQDPDPLRLEAAVGRPSRRALAAEADADLRDAQAMTGLLRAHALEDFTFRYPQHPYADNALIDAAALYEAAGREDAACALAKRAADEYPAGDAQSDALERLASCAARHGAADEAQKLMARLRADFPGTPAAQRAEARLSQATGRDGVSVPRDPARSGP